MAKLAKIITPDILGKLKGPGKSHLGIDIGNHTIKIVELRSTPRGMDLVHHAISSTPPGGFQVSVVATQLKEMIQEGRIKNKQAVIGLSGKGVATRRLSLPNIPEEEIQEAVRWQAGELFPFSLGDAMIAFQVLSRDESGSQSKQEVLVAAATREAVMEHVELLHEAGLEPVGLMAEPHAFEQLWRNTNLGEGEEGSIAVLDLGARKTSIHIFHGRELQFSRYVPTSGNAFTMALTGMIRAGEEEIELSSTQAEALKRQHGISSVEDRGKTGEGIPLSQVAVRIRPVLEKLETEISRSFDYYAFQFQGETISRLLLAGGGAQLKGIESFFAERFDVKVGFLDPLAPLIFEDSQAFSEVDAATRPVFTVAVGLSLPLTERFNLLPLDLQPHRKRWSVRAPVAYATLGLLFLFPLGQYVWQSHRQVASLQSAVNIKKTSFEQYKYVFQQYERVKAENSQLEARLAQLPKLDMKVPPLAAALRLISQKIPENMSLTNMNFEKREEGGLAVKLLGLIYGEKEDAFPMLTNFMEELGKAKIFSEVELESAGDQKVHEPAALAFEIGCNLK
ncbi:MAG: type IV pilus assembly protein PilM [Deltaproteobacteria bacterium]|nr:type IV pilus assembly protein PilM [Deltaproteobacteria bacterium]